MCWPAGRCLDFVSSRAPAVDARLDRVLGDGLDYPGPSVTPSLQFDLATVGTPAAPGAFGGDIVSRADATDPIFGQGGTWWITTPKLHCIRVEVDGALPVVLDAVVDERSHRLDRPVRHDHAQIVHDAARPWCAWKFAAERGDDVPDGGAMDRNSTLAELVVLLALAIIAAARAAYALAGCVPTVRALRIR